MRFAFCLLECFESTFLITVVRNEFSFIFPFPYAGGSWPTWLSGGCGGEERENCSKSRDLRDEVVRDPGGQVTLALHGM